MVPPGQFTHPVLDWAQFAALHATRGKTHPALLSPEIFQKLHAPVASPDGEPELEAVAPGGSGYAMGWIAFPWGVLSHSGANLKWFAQMAIIPDRGMAVVVACNQGGPAAEACCVEALQLLLKKYAVSE